MDDVSLATTQNQELQKSLDITNETSNKYHVEYGESKSNVLKIKHTRKKTEEKNFKIGEMNLEITKKYKYLRYIQNEKK